MKFGKTLQQEILQTFQILLHHAVRFQHIDVEILHFEEDVEILIRRCFYAAKHVRLGRSSVPLFTLVFPENLSPSVEQDAMAILDKALLSEDALGHEVNYCFAIVSSNHECRLAQRFKDCEVTRDDEGLNKNRLQDLWDSILCETEGKYYSQHHTDVVRPFVQVFASEEVGCGKSFLIQKWAERNDVTFFHIGLFTVLKCIQDSPS